MIYSKAARELKISILSSLALFSLTFSKVWVETKSKEILGNERRQRQKLLSATKRMDPKSSLNIHIKTVSFVFARRRLYHNKFLLRATWGTQPFAAH
jgi:hypothetical protein